RGRAPQREDQVTEPVSRPLAKEARSLLDAARGGDDPTLADKARVRAAVMGATGAGAGAKGATSATKIGLAVLAVAVIAIGAYWALRDRGDDGGTHPAAVT